MACELVTVDLGVPGSGILDAFVNLAKSQKEYFTDIFPWNIAKNSNIIMIIGATNLRHLRQSCRKGMSKAPSASTKICGWLTAIVSEDGSVYLAEISSRGAVDGDSTYKGMGRRLFSELISWCQRNNMGYIYLFPLNERVECIYRNWGLKKLSYVDDGYSKTTKKMFYRLSTLPDTEKIRSIQNSVDLSEIDIIAHALSERQMQFMEKLAEAKETDKNAEALFNKLSESIQGLIAICDDSELSAQVGKQFESLLKK